jgi:hypothetical protein
MYPVFVVQSNKPAVATPHAAFFSLPISPPSFIDYRYLSLIITFHGDEAGESVLFGFVYQDLVY